MNRVMRGRCLAVWLLSGVFLAPTSLPAQVEIRAENFTVPPSTGPVTHVEVRNTGERPVRGTVRLGVPAGWKLNAAEKDVELAAGETKRVPFAVERASDSAENRYAVGVSFLGDGVPSEMRKQSVFCASAPYFKPKIDGDLGEWGDAIPVTFTTAGKRTVVRTYWTKRQFSVAVEVEEDALEEYGDGPTPVDAVQFAVAGRAAKTPTAPGAAVARFEFLIVAANASGGSGRCFLLLKPGDTSSVSLEKRVLAGLELEGAEVSVRRDGGITRYECSVPFSRMRKAFRPSVGREFRFSLLVHDPDGTGVRDLGAAAGLSERSRSRLAWCSWPGVKWGEKAPYDSKIEWGLCSSKH